MSLWNAVWTHAWHSLVNMKMHTSASCALSHDMMRRGGLTTYFDIFHSSLVFLHSSLIHILWNYSIIVTSMSTSKVFIMTYLMALTTTSFVRHMFPLETRSLGTNSLNK